MISSRTVGKVKVIYFLSSSQVLQQLAKKVVSAIFLQRKSIIEDKWKLISVSNEPEPTNFVEMHSYSCHASLWTMTTNNCSNTYHQVTNQTLVSYCVKRSISNIDCQPSSEVVSSTTTKWQKIDRHRSKDRDTSSQLHYLTSNQLFTMTMMAETL